jgi:hypothetical protein
MVEEADRTKEEEETFLRQIGRVVAGAYYDYQGVRLRSMNQVRALIRAKREGLDLSKPEAVKEWDGFDEEQPPMGTEYADAKLWKLVEEMKDSGELTEEEFEYLKRLEETVHVAVSMEDGWEHIMRDYIEAEPIWTEWLKGVRGISTVLTANMLRNWGYCERSPHPSSLWRYCGLHLVCPTCVQAVMETTRGKDGVEKPVERLYAVLASDQGKCPRCGSSGVAERKRTWVDPNNSKKKKGLKLSFNPKQRVLAWKIVDSFVKQRTPVYRGIYDTEKARQLALMTAKAPGASVSKLQAEYRARRKCAKQFLAHYWFVARTMKELSVEEGVYVQAKLGHKNIVMPHPNEAGMWVLDWCEPKSE